MIYNIDEELEKYELARTNFSNVPANKWESTEVVTDEDGRTYTAGVKDGMLFELQPEEEMPVVAENQNQVALKQDINTPNVEEGPLPGIVGDTSKAFTRAAATVGENTTNLIGNVLGAPGDLGNYLARLAGNEDYEGIVPGSEAINNTFQNALSWIDTNLMGNNPIDTWAAEPYNNETFGNLTEGLAQFIIPAVPAAKLIKAGDIIVNGMVSLSPMVRGYMWGAIADTLAFPANEELITKHLAEYFVEKTPEERTEFANQIMGIFEKNPENAEIYNTLKTTAEGLVIGGIVDGTLRSIPFLRTAIRAAKGINWKELYDRIEIDPNTVSSGGLGGISLKKKPTDTEPGIIAFHGSGADFDEFKLEKIGTGEGAQVFGHGLYFSDSEDIAKFYRKQILYDNVRKGKLNVKYKNKLVPQSDTAETEASSEIRMVSQIVEYMNGTKGNSPDPKNAKADLIYKIELQIGARQNFNLDGTPIYRDAEEIELNKLITDSLENDLKTLEKINPEDIIVDIGKVYKVNIKTVMDDLIDYDKNLKEQNKKIQKILKPYYELYSISETADFGTLLESSYRNLPRDKFSEELSKEGIKGIKYKAGQLSGIDSDKTNFVIFDDKIIDIMAKMGIVGPMAISAIKNNKEQTQDNSI